MARSALAKPPARLAFSVLSVIAIGGHNVWLRENVEAQLLILGLLLAMTVGVAVQLLLGWALGPGWASSLALITIGWSLFISLARKD